MKKVCGVMVLLFVFNSSEAQTFKEWFQQKKTRIEYLVTQIGALQVYIEFAQKGYKIADQGLTIIGNIKRRDFNLHTDFLGALNRVNPKIRNSAWVADILALQMQIIQVQKKALHTARTSEQLTQREVDYIVRIYLRLLDQTADNMERLTMLITGDHYTLSDDERLHQIGLLHQDMQDKYGFARWFGDETAILIGNRQKERQDIQNTKALMKENE